MDKYEFQIKTEQLEKLFRKQDYKTAAKIADSIDWRKVRNTELLMKVAEVYERQERYEDSYEILNMAYDNAPIGRMIVYKMVQVAVKLGDFDEAVELYKEFIKIAPHDLGRYVLKYEIYRGRGSSLEDQIAILEEYKGREYQEQWAYELASLYYQDGMLSKCVEECDDLILWFSEGEYVIKAMELKMRIQPLTASQEEKYRQLVTDVKQEEIKVKPVNMDEFNTINLQAALAEELQDFIGEDEGEEAHTQEKEFEEVYAHAEEQGFGEAHAQKEEQKELKEVQEADAPKIKEAAGIPEEEIRIPRFLGQNESGQLTFDMQENVLERQITGQMTIEDILNGWEEKKKETEAAIAEAAKREEEKRKEREYLRATGKLPDLRAEVVTTLPAEIQQLIDEIEGRLPIKIHVEPIVKESASAADPKPAKAVRERAAEDTEEETELPVGLDDIADILGGGTEIKKAEEEKPEAEAGAKAEEAAAEEEETASTPIVDQLEKDLEEEVSSIPPGQLSEEQKKLFTYFTSVRGMKQQIAELLEEDRMRRERRDDSLQGNIVITGKSGNGKTTLASDLVKALQKQRRIKGARMAKVGADSLNGKDISAVVAKLGGGALLIEKAGNLKTETAIQLSHAMTRRTGGLLVILEDEKEEIRRLFIRCESLGAKFTRTIDIPAFTNKELVAFGESYAEEQEYVLDEMAVLALYNRIGNNQTSDHLVNVAEVKDMIDEAIERGGKKGLFGRTKKSRMDEFGHTILLEKDFEI